MTEKTPMEELTETVEKARAARKAWLETPKSAAMLLDRREAEYHFLRKRALGLCALEIDR